MPFDRGYVAGALQRSAAADPSRGRAATNYAEIGKNADDDLGKYQAAVDAARSSFSGRNDVSRDEFKKAIDENFAKYGGSKTGREMRGETPWSDFLQGFNDVTHGINAGIGGLIDAGFDNTVGNLAGIFDENLGKSVKNFATGEDLAVIPDIASDVLLSLPGWTVPLVVAKELARNSENIHEAVSGKDALTLENLDAGQRAAKGFTSALGVALSAVPGIGKAKSIAEIASKKGSKAAAEAAEKKAATKAEDAAKELAEAKKTYPNLFQEARGGLSEEGEKAANITNAIRKGILNSPTAMPKTVESNLAQEAAETAKKFAEKSTAGRVGEMLGNDMRGYAQALRDIPKTWKSSRDVVKAERELLKAGRKANKELKRFDRGKDAATKLDDDARWLAMEEAVGGEDALKSLLATSGVGDVSNLARKSGLMKTGLPIGSPQVLRSAGDVLSDIGVRGNSGLAQARGITNLAEQRKLFSNLAKYEELKDKKGSPAAFLQRAAIGTPEMMLNPTNARSSIKNTLLGTGLSLAAMPAGYMAEYGGDASQAFYRMSQDLDSGRLRPGAFMSAFFPVGSQRYLANAAIPGISGKLNSYHPYAALRTKDVANQFEDLAEEGSFGNTLENVKQKGKKNAR